MENMSHIIVCPPKSGSLFYNYKGFYSVVLMALADADYKFLWADIGAAGSASDAQIFNSCELKECLENGSLGLPEPNTLPNDNENVSYFFVGDDAFGLRPTTMKPFTLRGLTTEERIFNYRLSRAGRVVENAFGILANRFQFMSSTMQHQVPTMKLIFKTCLILYNLMRNKYPSLQNQKLDKAEDESSDLWPYSRKHKLLSATKFVALRKRSQVTNVIFLYS